ncbi:precursor of CEP8-like [Prosopis cineraria]|uniref:precursor of CEP8-like n=1 Tax=Prosopis cineraria TaxID=364024 RepID=UPI00240FE8A4|nr:precursor of CEP8-like [Prosopis cineraria]
MGQFQAMHKYLVVVVVLVMACHVIVITQGRQIKALKKNEDTALPAAEKAVNSVFTTKDDVNDVYEDSNGDDQVNAHRPTTPGNSPGVGHRRFEEDNKNMKTKFHVADQSPPNAEYSLTAGSKAHFTKPTPPYFSCGAGLAPHREIKT